MNCKFCGTQITNGMRFCPVCGAPIENNATNSSIENMNQSVSTYSHGNQLGLDNNINNNVSVNNSNSLNFNHTNPNQQSENHTNFMNFNNQVNGLSTNGTAINPNTNSFEDTPQVNTFQSTSNHNQDNFVNYNMNSNNNMNSFNQSDFHFQNQELDNLNGFDIPAMNHNFSGENNQPIYAVNPNIDSINQDISPQKEPIDKINQPVNEQVTNIMEQSRKKRKHPFLFILVTILIIAITVGVCYYIFVVSDFIKRECVEDEKTQNQQQEPVAENKKEIDLTNQTVQDLKNIYLSNCFFNEDINLLFANWTVGSKITFSDLSDDTKFNLIVNSIDNSKVQRVAADPNLLSHYSYIGQSGVEESIILSASEDGTIRKFIVSDLNEAVTKLFGPSVSMDFSKTYNLNNVYIYNETESSYQEYLYINSCLFSGYEFNLTKAEEEEDNLYIYGVYKVINSENNEVVGEHNIKSTFVNSDHGYYWISSEIVE